MDSTSSPYIRVACRVALRSSQRHRSANGRRIGRPQQQALYLRPEPQGQGSLRPTCRSTRNGSQRAPARRGPRAARPDGAGAANARRRPGPASARPGAAGRRRPRGRPPGPTRRWASTAGASPAASAPTACRYSTPARLPFVASASSAAQSPSRRRLGTGRPTVATSARTAAVGPWSRSSTSRSAVARSTAGPVDVPSSTLDSAIQACQASSVRRAAWRQQRSAPASTWSSCRWRACSAGVGHGSPAGPTHASRTPRSAAASSSVIGATGTAKQAGSAPMASTTSRWASGARALGSSAWARRSASLTPGPAVSSSSAAPIGSRRACSPS